jgi:chaperonin GroEL
MKLIHYHNNARSRLMQGVDQLARAVSVTLGPRGRYVIIEKSWGVPTVTKDGVTVAKAIDLSDKIANMGVRMVREVARKTSDAVGDGTTTATVLASSIFSEGMKRVVSGADPMALKRGIDKGIAVVVTSLREQAKPVRDKKEIRQVGSVSANNDATVGSLIADAMDKVGKAGVVTVEEAKTVATTLEFVEGMRFDRGYLSPYFVTDAEKMEVRLEEPYLLIHEKKISHLSALLPLLEVVAKSRKPLLIVAEDLDNKTLSALIVNKLRGTLATAAVKSPGFGDRRKEMLEDLAVLCGGKVISEALGIKLDKITLEDLGRCKSIRITPKHTTVVAGAGAKTAIEGRMAQIRHQIDATTSDYDREKLQERLAKMAGGVAVIHLGAATEIEMKEKKARVENALNSTRAAVEEGIVGGGGVALVRCLEKLQGMDVPMEEKEGMRILERALTEPLRQIARNAGFDGGIVLAKVQQGQGDFGFNAETCQYENLIGAGIIDPLKVVRLALQNAASVAGLMLTTEVAITEKPVRRSKRVSL